MSEISKNPAPKVRTVRAFRDDEKGPKTLAIVDLSLNSHEDSGDLADAADEKVADAG